MSDVYYGVEPYTGKIIQHFGIPGMKWGWTKDGKKTGAREARTDKEKMNRLLNNDINAYNRINNVLDNKYEKNKIIRLLKYGKIKKR